jgi:phosphatidylglycerophosphate synthase
MIENRKKYKYKEVKKTFHNEEPWVNMFVFSQITIPAVYLMVNYTKITPNQISLLSFIFGLSSAVFYGLGYVGFGASFYLVSYIFDATDGKIARLTGMGKVYGAWLDILIDRLNLMFISTAISYSTYNLTGDANYLVLNCIFIGLAFIGFESRYNIVIFQLKNNNGKSQVPPVVNNGRYAKWRKKYGLIKEPISLPEVFIFYFVVAPVFNIVWEALIVGNLFLLVRLIKQQYFWKHVVKN